MALGYGLRARVGRISRRLLAGVMRQMTNIRRKVQKTAFPPYLAVVDWGGCNGQDEPRGKRVSGDVVRIAVIVSDPITSLIPGYRVVQVGMWRQRRFSDQAYKAGETPALHGEPSP